MQLSLTSAGRSLIGMAVVVAAVGWLLGYESFYVLAATSLAAVGLGLVWVLPNQRVPLTRDIDPEGVTVGESSQATVSVVPGRSRRLPTLTIEDRIGDTVVVHTLPHGDDAVSYELPTDHRGVFTVGPARLRRRDPIGLWQRHQDIGHERVLYVYPRRHAVEPVAAGHRHDVDGPNASAASQGTIAFHSLREYRNGDDLRTVHWKSSARTGTLMVRQQADASQPQTTVVLDTRRAAHTPASFEVAVEVAASLTVSAAGLVLPVELRTTSGDVVGALGIPTAPAAFLQALAGVHLTDDGALALIEHDVRSSAADALVLVTAAPMAGPDRSAVTGLAQRFASLTIVNVRPDRGAYPTPGGSARTIDAADAAVFARVWNVDRP